MTGIVGGTFQFVIMISSLIIGGMTDRSRAYYSVTVGMLVLGAFGLAECGVSLNADRGGDLRYALIIVAILVGPLQPVSTELGVEVVYPLSENTVLVIQQLFSNLLSALFIPCFKKMKDIGINQLDTSVQQPEYTFSFYLLIVLHAGASKFLCALFVLGLVFIAIPLTLLGSSIQRFSLQPSMDAISVMSTSCRSRKNRNVKKKNAHIAELFQTEAKDSL